MTDREFLERESEALHEQLVKAGERQTWSNERIADLEEALVHLTTVHSTQGCQECRAAYLLAKTIQASDAYQRRLTEKPRVQT